MDTFGRYRLAYEPGTPDPYSGVLEHSVEMSISGEAELKQLLSLFDAFLKANGFVYDGELRVVEEEEAFDKQYWQGKYLELLRTPPEGDHPYRVTCQGSQSIDLIPFFDSKESEE